MRVTTALLLSGLTMGCVSAGPHGGGSVRSGSPAPSGWFQEARFGLFVHWGLYAIAGDDWPGVPHGRYSEWLMSRGVPCADYRRILSAQFQPRAYDPGAWADLAKEAGAGYLVVTTKHHDGFALWDSAVSDYDVAGTPHGRDLLDPLVRACRDRGLRIGFYYSVLDWSHPDYLPRRKTLDSRAPAETADINRYLDFMRAQVREIMTRYGRIDLLWWDGGGGHPKLEQSAEAIDRMARTLQPGILINNRNVLPGDFTTPEQGVPENPPPRPWESCMTINGSWGFHRHDHQWKSADVLVKTLSRTSSGGGNLLLNVGPDADGRIPDPCVERLKAMGAWMRVHAEAIRGTTASPFAGPLPWGGCTARLDSRGRGRIYLHVPAPARPGTARLAGAAKPDRAWVMHDAAIVPGTECRDGALVVRWPAMKDPPPVAVIVLEFNRSGVFGS